MWQDILIIIIALFVVAYVGYKVYCFFTKPVSPCDACVGCALKEQLKEKGSDCEDFKKKSK